MAEGLVGRRLLHGEYELTDVLGRGGMATVYRAYSRSLDAEVAIKVLATRLAATPGFRDRFRDEARSLANLHHPNLVEVHHFGEEDDLVYIVMRLVPSGTLKDRLRALDGPLDIVSTARLIDQVADALQHAHDGGLVHLDIKPANILLGRSDWPLLADFGITRAISRQETSRGGERIAGTPPYMSPEQCRGGPIDGSSDQYSLAVTAYELLTGQRPFESQTTETVIQQHLHEQPPPPRELNPGIPGPVEDVLLRGLAKSPGDRYPSIREFGLALSAATDRTRGVTLETKSAVATLIPSMFGVLALTIVGPLLLLLLPAGALIAGSLPLTWPFQYALAFCLMALLFGMRWPLIGLLTRAWQRSMIGIEKARQGYVSPTSTGSRWGNSIAGSIEAVVHLALLFSAYQLLAVPALTILRVFVSPAVQTIAETAVMGLVVIATLGLIVRIVRSGGPLFAALILIVAWAIASAAPIADVATTEGMSLVAMIKIAVGVSLLVVLIISRRSVHHVLRPAVSTAVTPLVAQARAGMPPEDMTAGRRYFENLACSLMDIIYFQIGFALLRAPAGELLASTINPLVVIDGPILLMGSILVRVSSISALAVTLGPSVAAIAVTALAITLWLLLMIRLLWQTGLIGITLGLLLSLPMLLSLPWGNLSEFATTWPATVATWGLGTLVLFGLGATISRIQANGNHVLGAVLDRNVLGVSGAPSEDDIVRRNNALGGVVGAFLNVGYLLVGFWALGAPATEVIGQAAGHPESGTILLLVVLLTSLVILRVAVDRAVGVLAVTGGSALSERAKDLHRLSAGIVIAMVAGGIAIPAVVIAPAVAGGLMLSAPRPPETWQVSVEIRLPPGFSPDVSRLSSSGIPSSYTVVDGRQAKFEARIIPTGADLVVNIDFIDPPTPIPATSVQEATPTPVESAPSTLPPEPTSTQAPPTNTPIPPTPAASSTPTLIPATSTSVAPTATVPPATSTPVAPTATIPPATVTPEPATQTPSPATSTPVPATPTVLRPTETSTTAPRQANCEAPVLATYYSWYDAATWDGTLTADLPIDLYNSDDRAVIARQVDQAMGIGVDGFVLNWLADNARTDQNLRTLLEVAASKRGFKVAADFDLNPGAQGDRLLTSDEIIRALRYLKDTYYSHPAWLRYQGKPVLLFYDNKQYSVAEWVAIRNQVDPNRETVWIGEGDSAILPHLQVFDGLHLYSITWAADPGTALRNYGSRLKTNWPNRLLVATVMPGYKELSNPGLDRDRADGQYYTRAWGGALETAPAMVLINSWNEWVEGHHIEPSRSYGNKYLDLSKPRIATFKQRACG
jgi:hypothetical protein